MSEVAGTYHKDHWVSIEPERFERYDTLFKVAPTYAPTLLAPVGAQAGETVLDFGCGPGYVVAELAKIVGPAGHAHGVDVNADFIRRSEEVAREAGVSDRCTFHHVLDELLPFAAATIDRALVKNVLEYVPDPAAVLRELHRVLRPGGTLTAMDSDWGFVVVEPLTADEVREVLSAAAPAFREPHIGRRLRGLFRGAGFEEVKVAVTVQPDERGLLRGVLENMLGYGLRFGNLAADRAADFGSRLDRALEAGDYMVLLPQFAVTGRR